MFIRFFLLYFVYGQRSCDYPINQLQQTEIYVVSVHQKHVESLLKNTKLASIHRIGIEIKQRD